MGAQWKSKHKELAANAKGKIFGKLAKEIMVAARGGADPDSNSRLRLVVEQAKKASMPKDTLERAIRKARACWTAARSWNVWCTKVSRRIVCRSSSNVCPTT